MQKHTKPNKSPQPHEPKSRQSTPEYRVRRRRPSYKSSQQATTSQHPLHPTVSHPDSAMAVSGSTIAGRMYLIRYVTRPTAASSQQLQSRLSVNSRSIVRRAVARILRRRRAKHARSSSRAGSVDLMAGRMAHRRYELQLDEAEVQQQPEGSGSARARLR